MLTHKLKGDARFEGIPMVMHSSPGTVPPGAWQRGADIQNSYGRNLGDPGSDTVLLINLRTGLTETTEFYLLLDGCGG